MLNILLGFIYTKIKRIIPKGDIVECTRGGLPHGSLCRCSRCPERSSPSHRSWSASTSLLTKACRAHLGLLGHRAFWGLGMKKLPLRSSPPTCKDLHSGTVPGLPIQATFRHRWPPYDELLCPVATFRSGCSGTVPCMLVRVCVCVCVWPRSGTVARLRLPGPLNAAAFWYSCPPEPGTVALTLLGLLHLATFWHSFPFLNLVLPAVCLCSSMLYCLRS